VFVNGLLIGGSTGLVRASSALVRGTQSGMLRLYAGMMLVGIAGVGLYFLLQS
jgi:NADH-quinone oxidoreductase subunit L